MYMLIYIYIHILIIIIIIIIATLSRVSFRASGVLIAAHWHAAASLLLSGGC